jgi:hypothetical protein
MADPVQTNCVLQGAGNMLQALQFTEKLWPPFSRQYLIRFSHKAKPDNNFWGKVTRAPPTQVLTEKFAPKALSPFQLHPSHLKQLSP